MNIYSGFIDDETDGKDDDSDEEDEIGPVPLTSTKVNIPGMSNDRLSNDYLLKMGFVMSGYQYVIFIYNCI